VEWSRSEAVRWAIRDIAAKPDARCSAGGAASRTHGKNPTLPPRSGREYFPAFRGNVLAEMSIQETPEGTSTALGVLSGGSGFGAEGG
jgi:hypothetical protein